MKTLSIIRPKSACAGRPSPNPILPSQQPIEMQRSGKASVNQSFYFSKYPEERPKGKTKTPFSKNSDSTFHIASEELVNHRPSIRVNIPNSTPNCQRPQSIRVEGYHQNKMPSREEIVTYKKRPHRDPSPILTYQNQKKVFLPSEITNRLKIDSQKSKVFEDTNESFLFNGKFKCLLAKPTEITQVIGYEFALEYRDQKITPKP